MPTVKVLWRCCSTALAHSGSTLRLSVYERDRGNHWWFESWLVLTGCGTINVLAAKALVLCMRPIE
jgi:hypothetical protein